MGTIIQRRFPGGEISPALYSSCDTVKYATGLRTQRNFFTMKHGGAANRGGSSFTGEVKDSTKTVRMIDFIFNESQTYALEFGDLYMRVIKQGAYITDVTKNISAATKANPIVVTSAAHGFTNGDEVYISGVLGMTQLNNRNFKIANVATNTFELHYMDGSAVDSTGFTTYSSAGTAARIYTIVSPYSYDKLPDVDYDQNADVMTFAHPSVKPQTLSRSGDASWAFADASFDPAIECVTNLTGSLSFPGTTHWWAVTAVDSETGEESVCVDEFGAAFPVVVNKGTIYNGAAPTSGSPQNLSWDSLAGAREYNIYRRSDGVWGFIGTTSATTFVDNGIDSDATIRPPFQRLPFANADDYPAAVTYYQQRHVFGGSNNNPQYTDTSKSGLFSNFTKSTPPQDDDAIRFPVVGRHVNRIKHYLDMGVLIAFASGGEFSIRGDTNGVLKPDAVNVNQESSNGSGSVRPIIIDKTAIYLQARGSIVRDTAFEIQSNGYKGNDLTMFASHLVEGFTITDWAYQQVPHSIVWAVRSDGTLLGLTYIKEQQIFAWHHHDTDGIFENVCVVPEGDEDAVYVVVKRSVNGRNVRYVERLNSRFVDDIVDSIFMDSALSYDGRNDTSTTMTLSGGTLWTSAETLTLTASASFFVAGDVGNSIFMNIEDENGEVTDTVRCAILTYISATVVHVQPHKTVPAGLRSTAKTTWSRAVDQVSGLWHLEGKSLSVLADGFVVANPNNDAYTVRTVSNGILTLDRAYAVIHGGLPVTADIETLDVDTAQGETVSDKKMLMSKVTMHVEKTRGLWLGPKPPADDDVDPLQGLTEVKMRTNETQDDPIALRTGKTDVTIRSEWNSNGRIFLRQTDPLPAAILSFAPAGWIPFRG